MRLAEDAAFGPPGECAGDQFHHGIEIGAEVGRSSIKSQARLASASRSNADAIMSS
jgi:hypothetical protein